MTVQPGDKVIMVPLRGGGYAAVRSGDISVGDKVVMIPGQDGRYYAVRAASPSVGDRVILYPLRGGGYVCLPSADDASGEPGTAILPPINFDTLRTGPSTADLNWALDDGNDGVRIVRRTDRYPTAINDGVVAYEGGGEATVDSGLDFRERYYYSAWGRAGSKYSNGYLTGWIGAYGAAVRVTVCPRGIWTLSGAGSTGRLRLWWAGSIIFDRTLAATPNSTSCISSAVSFGIPYTVDYVQAIEDNLSSRINNATTYAASQHPECRITKISSGRYHVDFEGNPYSGDKLWDDPGLIVSFQ